MISLTLSELFWPELINRYPTENARLVDVGISFLMVFSLMIYGHTTIKNELDYNRELAENSATEIATQKASVDKLNTKLTKLFSIISHDLKTPLANIKTTMKFLHKSKGSEIVLDELVPKLDRDIGLTINMLDNLLRWSKQQLTGVVISPEILNLSASLGDTIQLVISYAEQKQVELKCSIPDDVRVSMDPESLKLVVRNLAINAVKYSKKAETVAIKCDEDKNFVVLSFVDTGIGISEEKLLRLFELGIESEPGTDNEIGNGLGLYLCRTIIESYDGTLEVESTLGQGSKFRLRIPRGL